MTESDQSANLPGRPQRQPWSMKWVVLVIILGIALYTWLTLAFRKPENPNETWAEQQLRRELAVLDKAGWSKSKVALDPVVASPAQRGNVSYIATPKAVDDLRSITVDPWYLPVEAKEVVAPSDWPDGRTYTVYVKLDIDTDRMQVGGFTIFRKGSDIILVPAWRHYPDDVADRTRKVRGRLLFNPGDVPPGEYMVTIVAIKSCATWHLTVHGG